MIRRFAKRVIVPVKEYKSANENQGKVAIFDFDNSELIAEGESGSDWYELEILCEELRNNGNYKIVIVPPKSPEIKLFRRVMG